MSEKAGQKTGKKHSGIENLRPPWPPGASANPGGRPRYKAISDAYRQILEMTDAQIRELEKRPRTQAMSIALKIVKGARAGKLRHAVEVADRAEGTALRSVDVSGSLDTSPSPESVEAALKLWRTRRGKHSDNR